MFLYFQKFYKVMQLAHAVALVARPLSYGCMKSMYGSLCSGVDGGVSSFFRNVRLRREAQPDSVLNLRPDTELDDEIGAAVLISRDASTALAAEPGMYAISSISEFVDSDASTARLSLRRRNNCRNERRGRSGARAPSSGRKVSPTVSVLF